MKKAILEIKDEFMTPTATVKINGKIVGESYWGFYSITPDFICLYDRAPMGQMHCKQGELTHKIYIGDCEFEKKIVPSDFSLEDKKESKKDKFFIYHLLRENPESNGKILACLKQIFSWLGFSVYLSPKKFIEFKNYHSPIKFKKEV